MNGYITFTTITMSVHPNEESLFVRQVQSWISQNTQGGVKK